MSVNGIFLISVYAGVAVIAAGIAIIFINFLRKGTGAQAVLTIKILGWEISTNSFAVSILAIGVVLILVPVYLCPRGDAAPVKVYTVKGRVLLSGKTDNSGVLIIPRWPPLTPTPGGEILDCIVSRGPDGRFPNLSFVAPGYDQGAIDLNDPEKVHLGENEIRFNKDVILSPETKGAVP